MASLVRIGNSQGIRIPKPIINQARLENTEIEFEVLENGLLLKPIRKNKRENWGNNIREVLSSNKNIDDPALIEEMLDDSDLNDWEW